MAESDYILLYHRNSDVKTLKDFMKREYIYGITPDELFNQNKEYIWSQMTFEYKKRVFGKYNAQLSDFTVDTELPVPCKIKINPKLINALLSITQTNLQTDENDFYAFQSQEILKVLKQNSIKAGEYNEKSEPQCMVYVFNKSEYHIGTTADGLKNIRSANESFFRKIDNDIISVSTRVGEDGGSFTIRLAIIPVSSYEKKFKDSDILPSYSYRKRWNNDGHQMLQVSYATNKYSIEDAERNLYSNLISSNDLIFISFSKSKSLKNKNDINENKEEKLDISAENWDLIGLVDSVKTVVEPTNAYVEITGRDLMKLLIDDGSFFFFPSTCSDATQIFSNERGASSSDINSIDDTNPINRLRLWAGEIDLFARTINQDISFLIKGIISKLANIEICPGELFNDWSDKRTKFIELQPEKKK